MPIYRIMRETRYDPGAEAWRPALVWGYDREAGQITVRALPGYEPEAAILEGHVAEARGQGFDPATIWATYADDGGDLYFTARTRPEEVEAASLDAAVTAALRRLQRARPGP